MQLAAAPFFYVGRIGVGITRVSLRVVCMDLVMSVIALKIQGLFSIEGLSFCELARLI
jgi:hypothetical protein